ncbi:MAG: hypothetical protein OEZ36_11125 [Spirochaetota bacterium]|nr:hypothetical protein [Spirochaetota bacterium]
MIKKLYGIAFLLMLYFLISPGNTYSKMPEFIWNFGLKGGYGFTSAEVQNHPSQDSGLFSQGSLSMGGYVNFSHVDFAKVQLEVLFIQKGFKRSTYEASLNCFSFPILARFQIPQGGYTTLGFAITLLSDGLIKESGNVTSNFTDYFETLEFDLVGAIGWAFSISREGRVFIELRASYTASNTSVRYPEVFSHFTLHSYVGFQY